MQRTDDWFRQRRGKLTASQLGQCLGLTPWGSPKALAKQLYADLTEDSSDNDKMLDDDATADSPATKRARESDLAKKQKKNPALEWGTVMEPSALMEYTALTGDTIEAVGFMEHACLDWFGGSPDGLLPLDLESGTRGIVEAKCPFSKRLYADVPLYYIPQVNALCELTGAQWCDLICWTPEASRIWRVQADKQLFDTLMTHYQNFYGLASTGRTPVNPGKHLTPMLEAWRAAHVTEYTPECTYAFMPNLFV